MGEDGRWIFLEIVRRKHVVMRRNKGLEKPPGSTGGQPQGMDVLGARQTLRDTRRWKTNPVGNCRRSEPQNAKRRGDEPRLVSGDPSRHGGRQTHKDRSGHPSIVGKHGWLPPDARLAGRRPFKKIVSGDK